MDNNTELIKTHIDAEGNTWLLWHKSLLYPWADNPRTISETNELNFSADIKLNGIKDPLQILSDGMIVDGNHRFEIGVKEGIEFFPVKVNKITDKAQIWEIAFRDNGGYAVFDPDRLNEHLSEFEGKINTAILNITFEEQQSIDTLLAEDSSNTLSATEDEEIQIEDNTTEETQESNQQETPKPAKKKKEVQCPNCEHTFTV